MKNYKITIFWIVLGKSEKVLKKVKKMKKGQILTNLMKNDRTKTFWIVLAKHGKMSKKVKNNEKGSDIDEKGQN